MASNGQKQQAGKPGGTPAKLVYLNLVYNPDTGDFQLAGTGVENQVMAYGMLRLAEHAIHQHHHPEVHANQSGIIPVRGPLPPGR